MHAGAWNLLVSDNGNLRPVLEECFYVGDAAGRPKDGAFKKDFGCSDLKFALNVGIPFATPEQFFLGSRARIHCDRSLALLGFDPKTLPLTGFPPSVLEARTVDDKELVLFVGSPAAGKSWTAQRYFPDHVRICQDELGTKNACERAARDALRCGKNVVIDSTNPSVQKRSSWVRLATEEDARPHCILLSRDKGLCFHMNAFRKFNLASSEKRLVPNVAIHTFYKHYEQPTVNEGFASVLSVPFVPTFSTEDERRLFFSFLLK
jgi:bifunctional polynucleotide phosphatase/kinase